jgi:hypothetical protein
MDWGTDAGPGETPRTRTCEFRVRDLIRARFLPGVEVGLEDAKENIALTAKLTGGRRLPALIDLRAARSQSAEARAYLAGPDANRVSSAVALLIGSPISRVIGNFYLGVNRPSVPTRLFTDESQAEAWLRQFTEGVVG